MPKLVAIEWDSAEVRVVVGRTRGTEVVVEQAATAELPRKEEDADVRPHLAALLNQLQVGRSEVLVGVGRANIELRKMQLPPAPDEELPDMVRFQAMRQFTTIGEDWPLDYVPLQKNESGVEVLAAALSPNIVQQIQATCESLELTPKSLVLRPFAAASLLMRANPNETRCCLVVDVLATEADLFVLADGNVAFLRTVRLPDAEHASQAMVTAMMGEVRRTIAAAQSQMGGRRIDVLVVLTDEDRLGELRSMMGTQMTLPVEAVNPFSAVKLSGELERHPPSFPGRFAPLLGMMLDAASETGHRIDFLHPRKRPAPKSNRTRYLAITTAAVAAVCLFALLLRWQLDQRDTEVARLRQRVEGMKPVVDAAKKMGDDRDNVEKFLAGNTPWLSELEFLSQNMPPAKEAMVTLFTGNVQADGHTRINLQGLASTHSTVKNIETRMRDETHRVEPGETNPNAAHPEYEWGFQETIIVDPVDPDWPTLANSQQPSKGSAPASPSSASDIPVQPAAKTEPATSEQSKTEQGS